MIRLMPQLAGVALALTVAGRTTVGSQHSEETPKIPRLAGEYVTVYRPAADRFPGPDTKELKAGQWYDDWVPNDHAIVKGPDACWHAFGITHPLTSTQRVHEGEFQLFHAVAPPGPLQNTLRQGAWTDRPKVLPPSERPGEIPANHAPYIVFKDARYWMIYGPSPIRLASSADLEAWTTHGELFRESGGTRDPSVLLWEDNYYLVYCTGNSVAARLSKDLQSWGPPRVVLRMKDKVAPESPSLLRFDGTFYLFVCGWDGVWDRKTVQGAYQHRTYVYQSDDPLRFDVDRPITCLDAHAPEVFRSEDGRWFISSAEWPSRGVSLAELVWE